MNAEQTHYPLIGILGGTFDPIHNGHLAIAKTLSEKLTLEQIQFIPSGNPPHRTPQASPQQRLDMLTLALEPYPNYRINDLEIKRQGPSYMVDTLTELSAQYPGNALALILGADVFTQLNQWHQWQRILKLAHIIVVNRPNHPIPQQPWITSLLTQHQCQQNDQLHQKRSGYILSFNIPPQATSATNIRHSIKQQNAQTELPAKVATYIKQHQLYQI